MSIKGYMQDRPGGFENSQSAQQQHTNSPMGVLLWAVANLLQLHSILSSRSSVRILNMAGIMAGIFQHVVEGTHSEKVRRAALSGGCTRFMFRSGAHI